MQGKGHVLSTSNEPRWRCQVCTFANLMTAEACRRCREPTTEEERQQYRIKAGREAPRQGRAPTTSSASATRARANKSSSSSAAASSSSKSSTSSSSFSKSKNKGKGKGGGVMHGVKKKQASTRKFVQQTQHKGDLGYKRTIPQNQVRTFTRSRLNEATASYAAKFSKDDQLAKAGKRTSGNIHTVGSSKVNGLTKSSAAIQRENKIRNSNTQGSGSGSGSKKGKKKGSNIHGYSGGKVGGAPRRVNPHDEVRADVPAKYRFGSISQQKKQARTGGLLGQLQAMATSSQVASLKHTKRGVNSSKKNMGSGVSSLNL
eukprot:TRINITY_DN68053_c3_g1_i1.p2 TRINITY_DN68053_c3_g1~~TRINITY_DN68053_c3_g1_i1.p2  ORF type:complete len:328 (+),score=163.22 TRINITY_DN68053_c3_g1_i1:37-984(+)